MKTLRKQLLNTTSALGLYYGPIRGAETILAVQNLIYGLRALLYKD